MIRVSYLFRTHPRLVFSSLAGLVILGGGYLGTRSPAVALPAMSANSGFSLAQTTTTIRSASAAAPVPVPEAGISPSRRSKLGINLWYLAYWSGERAFANLTMQSAWTSITPGQPTQSMDLSRINPDGSVKSLNPGEIAVLPLTPPGANPQRSATIRCTWSGTGEVVADGGADFTNRTSGDRWLRFTWSLASYPTVPSGHLKLNATNPADPVRNIDCREEGMAPDKLFADEFIQSLAHYGAIRFMIWQGTMEKLDTPSRWSTRRQANAFVGTSKDGVAIEHMVELAKQTNSDPWFSIPWNADEEYVTRFAQYVHDNLPPSRKVYVELDNEVWNYAYPVTTRAREEGEARGLGTGHTAVLRRYAQKIVPVMKIWSRVFADRPGQLVRVAATQHVNPSSAEEVLAFGNTAQFVDALATAPYFGHDLFNRTPPNATMDERMLAIGLSEQENLEFSRQNRAIAQRYGKRYVTYESGQHIITSDLPLQASIQRHPKMYDIHRKFLADWDSMGGGDLNMLMAATGGISWSGAWGLKEYIGQPLSETPKLRAVLDYASGN